MCCDCLLLDSVFDDVGCPVPHETDWQLRVKCWKWEIRAESPSCCSSANSYHEHLLNISAGSPRERRRFAASSVSLSLFLSGIHFLYVIYVNCRPRSRNLFKYWILVINVISVWTLSKMPGVTAGISFKTTSLKWPDSFRNFALKHYDFTVGHC